jgi:hypothetical protein
MLRIIQDCKDPKVEMYKPIWGGLSKLDKKVLISSSSSKLFIFSIQNSSFSTRSSSLSSQVDLVKGTT